MLHKALDEDGCDLNLLLYLVLVGFILPGITRMLLQDVRVQARCRRGLLLALCTLQHI